MVVLVLPRWNMTWMVNMDGCLSEIEWRNDNKVRHKVRHDHDGIFVSKPLLPAIYLTI